MWQTMESDVLFRNQFILIYNVSLLSVFEKDIMAMPLLIQYSNDVDEMME